MSTVSVTLRDASTRGPIDAFVALSGASTLSDSSDIDGNVTFAFVVPGEYTIVVRRQGYEPVERSFRVDPSTSVQINIELLKEHHALSEIAVVQVQVSRAIPRYALDEASAAAQLHYFSIDALRTVPGLNLSNSTLPGQALNLSIEGHDAGASSLRLDDVPLNVPGMAFDLSAIDFDLIDRISVNYTDGQAGSVTMRTVEPTLSWKSNGELAYGSFNRSFVKVSEQGTVGNFGVALEYASRENPSTLSGATYLDESGLDYEHKGDDTISGTLFNVRYNLGSNAIKMTSIQSSQHSDLLCNVYTNSVPCGYGPGNTQNLKSGMYSVSDDFLLGSAAVAVGANHVTSQTMLNLSGQVIDGVSFPASGLTAQGSSGIFLHFDDPIGATTLSLNATSNALNFDQYAFAWGSAASQQLHQTYHYSDYDLGDSFKLRNGFGMAVDTQGAALTGAQGAISAGLALSRQSSSGSSGSLSLRAGRGINGDGSASLLSSPLGLLYDCHSETATGEAPGDPRDSNSYLSARLQWARLYAAGEISAQVYGQVVRNPMISALIPAGVLNPGLFYSGYFSQVNAFYGLPTNCGASAAPPEVYFQSLINATSAVFDGAHVEARERVLRNLVLDANMSWTRAAAWSNDPRLSNPAAIFRSGSQLPGVPIFSGFASLAYSPSGTTQYLLGAEYEGYDNSRGLPPNALLDGAIVYHLKRGVVSLVMNNLLNVYHEEFSSPKLARPLVRADGETIPGIANPYGPPTVTVSYAFAVGRDAVANTDATKSFPAAPKNDSLVPGLSIVPWPLIPPMDPFVRNTEQGCGNEDRAHSDAILDPIEELVQRLESPRTKIVAGPLANIGSTFIEYTPVHDSFALTFTTTKVSTMRAILYCSLLHFGVQANAESAGLPEPAQSSLNSFTFYFTPSVGIYYIPMRPKEDLQQRFRTYPMPLEAPRSPFALQSEVCLPELRPTAARLLAELESFFDRGTAPADWEIVSHRSEQGETWYQLSSDDIGTTNAVISCAHVSAVKGSDVRTMGLNGIGPGFNYARRIGLYILTAP